MLYLWIKSIHVVFIVAWFAGLFYLPRLYAYHAEVPAEDRLGHERFVLMERRLYALTTVGLVLTWVLGIALLVLNTGWLQQGWLHAKLTLVLLLSGYHGFLGAYRRQFAAGTNRKSARWWKIVNEIPTVLLVAIVALVIVKPF